MESILTNLAVLAGAAVALIFALFVGWFAIFRRVVVPTNEVHIVQRGKQTVSYGSGLDAGNVYYKWPEFVPKLGLTVRVLPTSVFDIPLSGYEAYDQHRVPFQVDVVAFFRIKDSNVAAQRVSSTSELMEQLTAIVQGAVRTTLAKHEIDDIMSERAKFGAYFTEEVQDQLPAWGVEAVKNIELMNVQDTKNGNVIQDIMAKRISEINKESRVKVAENTKAAKLAEIENQQQVDIRRAEAEQRVGQRQAEAQQVVGIAEEQALQAVKEQAAITAAKTMEVRRVEQTKQAEIDKDVAITNAEQDRATTLIEASAEKQQIEIRAEAEKRRVELAAEGNLTQQKLSAEGIEAEGKAKAAAETAILLAPVTAQITLAEKIGSDQGYQNYLVSIRQLEALERIGVEQAEALTDADIKIFASAGEGVAGSLSSVTDLFSAKGGLSIASMLEALKQTPTGKEILGKVTGEPA